jgi:phage portal protein BeeE
MLKGQPDEYVEFDTAALLRSAFKDRIEGLTRGVQGGILAPNEARNSEGYDAVEFGDEPRV